MPSPASPANAGGGHGHSHAEAHAAIAHSSSRIAAISLLVTVCLLALKLVVGLISGSIAVLSDAVDSGTDLVGGAAALVSVRIAATPADETHPYGHGKIEAVSASVAATIIGLGGGLITYQAIRRLVNGSPDIDIGIGLAAMGVAAAANLVMALYMRRAARRSESMALRAEATHLQTNVVQAGAIIAGLVLVAVTDERAFDPITALCLAAYMAYASVGLVRTALEEVLDSSLPPAEIAVIQDVLRAHEGEVRAFHRLRTRRSGRERHVDMHVVFAADRNIADVHETSDRIEADIAARLPGTIVVIHTEPEGAEGP